MRRSLKPDAGDTMPRGKCSRSVEKKGPGRGQQHNRQTDLRSKFPPPPYLRSGSWKIPFARRPTCMDALVVGSRHPWLRRHFPHPAGRRQVAGMREFQAIPSATISPIWVVENPILPAAHMHGCISAAGTHGFVKGSSHTCRHHISNLARGKSHSPGGLALHLADHRYRHFSTAGAALVSPSNSSIIWPAQMAAKGLMTPGRYIWGRSRRWARTWWCPGG